MSINSIEIICLPCPKCELMKQTIMQAVKSLEFKHKVKLVYEFKLTPHLKEISKYSLNPSQVPIVLINGEVEFCGSVKPDTVLPKLDAIYKMG